MDVYNDMRSTRKLVRTCEECGREYHPTSRAQRYCCAECREKAAKRRKEQGSGD